MPPFNYYQHFNILSIFLFEYLKILKTSIVNCSNSKASIENYLTLNTLTLK